MSRGRPPPGSARPACSHLDVDVDVDILHENLLFRILRPGAEPSRAFRRVENLVP